MKRPQLGHLWHVALKVRDLAACERFYTEVLGLAVEWRPDADNVYLCGNRDNLALHRDPQVSGSGALDHIGFVLETPESVDAWHVYLMERGVVIAHPPKTHRDGARSLYCRDPEGHLVQLIYHPSLFPLPGG
ncbi:MAG: VOC family protein [Acidiferrobacteraceae bacterium]